MEGQQIRRWRSWNPFREKVSLSCTAYSQSEGFEKHGECQLSRNGILPMVSAHTKNAKPTTTFGPCWVQIKPVPFSSVKILSLSHLHLNAPNSRSSSPGRLSIYSNPESPSRQSSATPLTQAPNTQTSMTHYFLPHDMRPSFSSVMSGFLTSWMKEPELYTPWSARQTSASKGSHPRCLSVNIRLNSSNIQSFSLAVRHITPQSVEEIHATHVDSVSTPSSGSGMSVEATRLKLVTCDLTPNEQRVTEAETIPSSEIPGSWEGLDEEQIPTISKHKVASIIQPSGSLAAKATTTQPLDTECARIYSNEEVRHVAFHIFSESDLNYIEWSLLRFRLL